MDLGDEDGSKEPLSMGSGVRPVLMTSSSSLSSSELSSASISAVSSLKDEETSSRLPMSWPELLQCTSP
uniref:Uncharacterized protein n=1 Tax=Arundo donax TaxID=35708 RepID=A0A0A8ZA83_ARUDO